MQLNRNQRLKDRGEPTENSTTETVGLLQNEKRGVVNAVECSREIEQCEKCQIARVQGKKMSDNTCD